ncbi:L-lactate dehydrogenase [Xylogone sp. PMI_703]|nr:L-lactate dehydrogenase [Xylogone sp. PMI_703]
MDPSSAKRKSNQVGITYDVPDPNSHVSYQGQIYASLRRPLFSAKPAEWEALARAKVPAANFGYVYGSAGTGSTNVANLTAFGKYRFKPRMLVNVTRRDTSIELFGTRYSSPLLVAPVGVQAIMHRDGEEATARACREVGVPMILSTSASRSIEQVAAANGDGDRWYQLYWPRPQLEEITVSLLNRAKQNGYKVLVVTLDSFYLGWRPHDLDRSYLPFFWGVGCQVGHSDPVFQRMFNEKNAEKSSIEKLKGIWNLIKQQNNFSGAAKIVTNSKLLDKSRAWLDVINSATYREWHHLETLKKLWDGPIVLKGIQTVEDAHKAIEYGMDGIVVSNHGGRQLDGAMSSLDALAAITADEKVINSNLTILFDSGIRTGSDVLKAICLGANAVLIGRPYVYGLAIKGQAGVEHVLRCLLADTDNSLANLGKRNLKELCRHDLQILPESKL